MAALGRFLRSVEGGMLSFWCPGCEEAHVVRISSPSSNWTFNGNAEAPSFSPSVLVTSGHYLHGDKPGNCYCDLAQRDPEAAKGNRWKCRRCHSFVTDGRIQFLGDSTHALAGQTVPMVDFP